MKQCVEGFVSSKKQTRKGGVIMLRWSEYGLNSDAITNRIAQLDKLIEVKTIQIQKHIEERERLMAFKEGKK